MTGGEPELELDMRGRLCPIPVIELARRIGEVPLGAIVVVLADDPAARVDIPAWSRLRRQDYLGAADTPRGPAYRVRRAR